ncbi:MAG: flagellar biosynthesis anti-sigma factor FlgM [Lachnospiraceae bacterium]|nr:flagellar biosynthesis anti-sigma factor FlgM [Lachnospiraceae bacterium]MBP3506717.1 flagellar biosynthesis anti-sigma factor FlgM [Lachnospiraceae bacterium]
MRIDAYNQINQLYGTSKTRKTGKAGYAGSVNTTDQVSFSSIGKDMQIAKAALAKVPDVREDKVNALKTAIDNGTYNVSNESFAEKLMSAYAERTM